MPDDVNTGGGSVVGGDVDVQDGTFIGRDQIIVISGYSGRDLEEVLGRLQPMLASGKATLSADRAGERLSVTSPGEPSIVLSSGAAAALLQEAARQGSEQAYLTALRVNPRYGRWATQFVPLAGTLTTLERPPGWSDVPPEFTLLEVMGEGAGRQIRRTRLEDMTEAMARHEALALLGEPGAGKTTTLYKLALDAAGRRLEGGAGPLPLFLPLANYRDVASPYDFVRATWEQSTGLPDLAERLRRGEILLLLDALNEMPFQDLRDYRERVGTWRNFVREWPGNRVVVTCRSRDYSEPLGLPQVEIERLDNARVQDFLGKYLPAEQAAQAWTQLADSPLLELVRNPYYLHMLAFIVASGGAWPANRGRLFEAFAGYLLTREQTRNHADWPGVGPLQKALAALAESIQPLGEGTRLPRPDLLARIPTEVPGGDGPVATPPPVVLRLGLAATLLDTELAGEKETIRFYHHQLQEYFAARALRDRFVAGEDISEHWRTPRLAGEMPDPGPLGDYEPLPPPPANGWEEPTILAAGLVPDADAFVTRVREVNPVLAGRCLIESGMTRPPELVETLQQALLDELGDRGVHLRGRLAAGDTLGRLGDPRFEAIEVEGQRVLLPPLVRIPAGPFRMGSSWWEVWRLSRGGFPAEDERPRHTVSVPEFSIGRYPVTNAEYACFVDAGGYQNADYWRSDAARAWLHGEAAESGVVKVIMDRWHRLRRDPTLLHQWRRAGFSPQEINTWEQLARMQEEEVRELAIRQIGNRARDRPAYWDDERYNGSSQPVVGVTWFEANAYCAWLEEQVRVAQSVVSAASWPAGAHVRLPTEAEWEKAARGDRGWKYPWGNRWDAGRANTWEGHVLRPNPVGAYPEGSTPEGVYDLSGNVWEWTQSLYQPYPYRSDDGRNEPNAEGRRVVRGGSWDFYQGRVRCACRYGFVPDPFDNDLGLRLVVSLSASDY